MAGHMQVQAAIWPSLLGASTKQLNAKSWPGLRSMQALTSTKWSCCRVSAGGCCVAKPSCCAPEP